MEVSRQMIAKKDTWNEEKSEQDEHNLVKELNEKIVNITKQLEFT
jgi:hypothetical protein